MGIGAGISGSTLKIIAMFSMAADHFAFIIIEKILEGCGIDPMGDRSAEYIAGLMEAGDIGYYYLAYVILRDVIGRIAFPIFCFLLVEGFHRTGNRGRYAGRLFLFAMISEVPFNLMWDNGLLDPLHQNIFFTLLIGLLMMWGMEKAKYAVHSVWLCAGLQLGVFAAAGFTAEWINCDYGVKGITAIALLFLFSQERGREILAGCIAFLWEPAALPGFIPVAFYNGKRGLSLKYTFYLFYPLHLFAFYYLSSFIK